MVSYDLHSSSSGGARPRPQNFNAHPPTPLAATHSSGGGHAARALHPANSEEDAPPAPSFQPVACHDSYSALTPPPQVLSLSLSLCLSLYLRGVQHAHMCTWVRSSLKHPPASTASAAATEASRHRRRYWRGLTGGHAQSHIWATGAGYMVFSTPSVPLTYSE
ncbi:unnamed protein product [Schistocephalus solidus]|uniref:Uncharacterized protein n=1 Tax=Schistocephalus solidus TaxID=70667 RepID=A0A183SSS8_SCHSO|nr:unnamed protein product [Schistocephalus solidus]